MTVLTEAQWIVMTRLLAGEKVAVAPITRRTLQKRGFITISRIGRGPKLNIMLTEAGRKAMETAVKEVKL